MRSLVVAVYFVAPARVRYGAQLFSSRHFHLRLLSHG